MKPTKTIDEEIKELKRELAMRDRVYKSWIASGKITREQATKQYEDMRSALARLQSLRDREQQGNLF